MKDADLGDIPEGDKVDLAKLFGEDEIESCDIAGLTAAELEKMLHELQARRLVEIARDPARYTPGFASVIRGFLKDNEVTGLDIPGTALNRLREKINEEAPFQTGTDG